MKYFSKIEAELGKDSGSDVWIGFNKSLKEGHLTLRANYYELFSYMWKVDQPNNSSNCTLLSPDTMQISSVPCDQQHSALCEKIIIFETLDSV